MSLVIPYTEKIFTKTCKVNYGSGDERLAFIEEVAAYIQQVSGIALLNTYTTGAGTSCVSWVNKGYYANDPKSPKSLLNLIFDGSSASTNFRISTSVESNAAPTTSCQVSCIVSATQISIRLRWIKSGNSFFFGFGPRVTTSVNNGWIGVALTPIRKASNSTDIVTYGIALMDASKICHTVYPGAHPYDDARGACSRAELRNTLPAVGSLPILLRPLYMNTYDYYFENVYVANVVGNTAQETIIYTDKGVFLVAQWYNLSNDSTHPSLVFDITKAIAGTPDAEEPDESESTEGTESTA